MSRDFTLGCVTLAVAAVYYAAAAMLPPSQLDDVIGPSGLPKTYGVVLAGLSVILMAQSTWARRVQKDAPYDHRVGPGTAPPHRRPGPFGPGAMRIAGMILIGILYIAAAPWLGYIVSLAALILATTYYQGGRLGRRVSVVAISGAIVFWLLFVVVLGIPQPAGFWRSLF